MDQLLAETLAGWRRHLHAHPGLTLHEGETAAFVAARLRDMGIEVTEGVFVQADDPALTTLDELVDLGVRIAVDDFGTGYSCLSYLGRLPLHTVKIDRSLVVGMADCRGRAVVEALLQMCAAMGLSAIAEGVEHPEQAEALAALGVRLGQGWLWSKALAPADVPAVLGLTVAATGAGPRRAPRPGAPQAPSAQPVAASQPIAGAT